MKAIELSALARGLVATLLETQVASIAHRDRLWAGPWRGRTPP